jgi:thiamine-phosphate pyrophosphorylase
MSKYPCNIYLTIDTSESATARLAAALAAAKIAAVLIAPAANRQLDAASAKPLLDLAQAQGVAAFIHGDAALARTLKADGVHLPRSLQLAYDFAEARKILGPGVMIGVDAGTSRHDAMEMAEAGAEYIALSVIDPATLPDDEGASTETGGPADEAALEVAEAEADDDNPIEEFSGLDLISWWVDVFQTPCVALDVTTPELAAEVAQEGCEFINITLEPGLSPAATADFVRVIATAATA